MTMGQQSLWRFDGGVEVTLRPVFEPEDFGAEFTPELREQMTAIDAFNKTKPGITVLKGAEVNINKDGSLDLDDETLADLIRPSGYFRVKAKRLKAFLDVLCGDFGGDLEQMLSGDLMQARQRLLGISGIGEETADSMLLYAGGRPVFVVDAYTRRILTRHGIIDGKLPYGDIQCLFMNHMPRDAGLYNRYHALIVETGKRYCRKEPRCEACPLRGIAGRDGGGKTGQAPAEPEVRQRGRATCSSGKKSSRRDSRKSGTPLS